MATFTLNGNSLSYGATNGASTDAASAVALITQLDAIIASWQASYAADGPGFYKQGGAGGSLTGGQYMSMVSDALKLEINKLTLMIHG